MKEILNIIHKTIYQFFDACEDDKESPMSDKDKLLLEVNKAICNNLKALEQTEPKECVDCISRQAVIDRINKLIEVEKKQGTDDWGYGRERVNAYEAMLHFVKSEYLYPSVEPERKTGEWVAEQQWCLPKCSICGASCFGLHGFDAIKTPYCPTCGAKMEVEE